MSAILETASLEKERLNMRLRSIYLPTMIFTFVGLAAGVAYREITKFSEFDGRTQLAFAHTHLLALGALLGLIFLVLERTFQLSKAKTFKGFLIMWVVGVAWTSSMLIIKGSLQIFKPEIADHAAIAGVSGIGHIALTVGFIMFFMALSARVKAVSTQEA